MTDIEVNEVCDVCGKSDDTVTTLYCGYHQEINNEDVEETICYDCEHEHIMEI